MKMAHLFSLTRNCFWRLCRPEARP